MTNSAIRPRSALITWPERRQDPPVITVRWTDNASVRCNGAVSGVMSLTIAPNRQYTEGIINVVDALEDLIEDAWEDYQHSERAFNHPIDDDDLEDEMGSG